MRLVFDSEIAYKPASKPLAHSTPDPQFRTSTYGFFRQPANIKFCWNAGLLRKLGTRVEEEEAGVKVRQGPVVVASYRTRGPTTVSSHRGRAGGCT